VSQQQALAQKTCATIPVVPNCHADTPTRQYSDTFRLRPAMRFFILRSAGDKK
jgi:hypothetical protein